MFKRVFWFAAGTAVGVAGMKKAERAVQERMERYSPPAVASSLGSAARDLGDDLRDAVRHGRSEMRRTEAELTAQHDPARRPRREAGSLDPSARR